MVFKCPYWEGRVIRNALWSSHVHIRRGGYKERAVVFTCPYWEGGYKERAVIFTCPYWEGGL